jgi:NitT/TauT family transport system substrate-binding protein
MIAINYFNNFTYTRGGILRLCTCIAAFCTSITVSFASANETLRLAVQRTGTVAFEIELIKDKGLDKAKGLTLEISELASTEAGKIALRGGATDMIVTDIFWVARERALGTKLLFYPYSNAIGAIMVQAQSPFKELADLRGKKLGVAGGPLDKSWLLLQAFAKGLHIDLKKEADIVYGTPQLLAQELSQGRLDANLNFWNFCASLETQGMRRLISMIEVEKKLGVKAPFASIGYVFDESLVATKPVALQQFFVLTKEARELLKANSAEADAEWTKIGAKLGLKDKPQLALFRKTYVEGIPSRPLTEEAADARTVFEILSTSGGAELLGPATTFDPAIYYQDRLYTTGHGE